MEEFIQAVREEGMHMDIEFPFRVDGVKGWLNISYNSFYDEYEITFEWRDKKKRSIMIDEIPNAEELANWILEIKNGKFMGDEPIFTEKKKQWMKRLRNLILEKENRDPETCYICFEDTFHYKTPCEHDICYTCFLKSLKSKEDSTQKEFTCGICRRKNQV